MKKIYSISTCLLIAILTCSFFSCTNQTQPMQFSSEDSTNESVCTHSYVNETTKNATCKEEGESVYTCNKCGDSYKETIPILEEHSVNDKGVCVVCGVLCTTEGVRYEISADGTYGEILGYEGTGKDLVVADTYKGLPVEVVYEMAFFWNAVLRPDTPLINSIVLSDTIKIIGNSAFSKQSLSRVHLGDNLEEIGNSAFVFCEKLRGITFPTSLKKIGTEAFAACTGISNIMIPERVEIYDRAFRHCDNLSSVTIGKNCALLGSEIFKACDKLTAITFEGTKQEWQSLTKSLSWKSGSKITSINCKDGILNL